VRRDHGNRVQRFACAGVEHRQGFATHYRLWPFEILVFGALSAAIMLVLAFARKVGGVRT
jgi:hypothetical protein